MTQYKYNCSGPWDNEPDNETWIDGETGYKCEIIRHPNLGHLSGYVYVPETHPIVGLTWFSARVPDIHGGITTLRSFMEFHLVGFDCAHSYDFVPGRVEEGADLSAFSAPYRSWPYVRRQVEWLARQLAEMTQAQEAQP